MARRALCVGINQFKNYPDAELQGCVNDALDMQEVLEQYFEFADSDVKVLTDELATKVNIMSALTSMVDEARRGKIDYLVFSMSSHGTQVPDIEGDEPDKADEAFCPYDLEQAGNEWDRDHLIVDDELHDLFITLPENVILECYLDTCHSGTGLKAIDLLFDRRPRYLPPPSVQAYKMVENRVSRSVFNLMRRQGVAQHILWAACRADQTSADARIEGKWHGAFTFYLCRQLRNNQATLPRAELLQRIRDELKKNDYPQIPQLECDATARERPIARPIEVRRSVKPCRQPVRTA
jgi:metacaspase-1